MKNITNKITKKGFTLIETLVVLSVIGLISAMGINFLSTITKGSTKTNITTEIKQNGNYVLDVMSYYIRNSTNIISCSGSSISLRQWDGTIVNFTLLDRDDTNKINARIASNAGELTNGDKDSGINVTNLLFVCTSTTQPTVKISFTMTQSYWLPDRPEFKTSVPFETTLALRSY